MKKLWFWITANFRDIERAIVTFAAILAIWPIGQWVSERDDRRLERAALLVQARIACEDAKNNNFFFVNEHNPSPLESEKIKILSSFTIVLLCSEIDLAVSKEPISSETGDYYKQTLEDMTTRIIEEHGAEKVPSEEPPPAKSTTQK